MSETKAKQEEWNRRKAEFDQVRSWEAKANTIAERQLKGLLRRQYCDPTGFSVHELVELSEAIVNVAEKRDELRARGL